MSTTPSTVAVVSNPDLLTLVFAHLDTAGIANSRLASKYFDTVASPHLFNTLRLGFRKRYLRRLSRVAAIEKFAKGVREIVWDTAHYSTNNVAYNNHDILYLLVLSGAPYEQLIQHDHRDHRAGLARLTALAKDEKDIAHAPRLMDVLVAAFEPCMGLKALTITNWSNKNRMFFDLDAVLARSALMPPPFRTLLQRDHSCRMQNQGFSILLTALSRAETTLLRLTIAESPNQVLGDQAPKQFDFPGILLGFAAMSASTMRTLTTPLKHLRELRLELVDKDVLHSDTLVLPHLIANDGLKDFLAPLENLEKLSLRIHAAKTTESAWHTVIVPLRKVFSPDRTLRYLRKLTLADFWLEPAELSDFLTRHAPTLEELTFKDINLGETSAAPEVVPGTVSLPFLEAMMATLEVEEYPKWEVVSRSCRGLSKLRGLTIQGPSVGLKRIVLGYLQVDELVEEGMDGRENCLKVGHFGEIWE